MYDKTVTLFVEYESTTAHLWYPFVLSMVDLNTDRGQILKKYGADSTDNAELHIAYTEKDGQKYIRDSSGILLPWIPRKEWAKQTNDKLSESISFGAKDFFMLGEWTGGVVNDDDYSDRRYSGFYAYMNDLHDYVYLISSVGGPYTVIPHFEILGK
jgi:hypothetical protein